MHAEEQRLIESAIRGDRPALEALLEATWPDAYRLSRSILRDEALAADAAQEACVIIYRTLGSLRDPAAFRGWWHRIVTREALRLAKRRVGDVTFDDLSDTEAAALVRREQSGQQYGDVDLQRALAALPVRRRTVLLLRYYAELDSSAIGAALGVPASTVRFHLASAKRQLHRLLSAPARGESANHQEVSTHA
ncbi:MAG: RNA polymerase sigma factor [Vulcanimicrobiaceae bacterium]